MITDLQNSDTWKILLTIAINFISSIDTEKEHLTSMQMKFFMDSLTHFVQDIETI